jgi:hypothetical protein
MVVTREVWEDPRVSDMLSPWSRLCKDVHTNFPTQAGYNPDGAREQDKDETRPEPEWVRSRPAFPPGDCPGELVCWGDDLCQLLGPLEYSLLPSHDFVEDRRRFERRQEHGPKTFNFCFWRETYETFWKCLKHCQNS